MTKLQKWRADQWLPGVKNGSEMRGEADGYSHKRAPQGVLVEMELFCISTVLISWL